jgi:hypothetical protein
MPIYTFVCMHCDYTRERNVPMDDRDGQFCNECGNRLNRAIDRPGMVWAPTAGGYR